MYTVGIFDGANPDSDINTNFEYGNRNGSEINGKQLVAANRYIGLTEDKDFTVTVTVSPKKTTPTSTEGEKATAKSGTDTKKINVFKPVLTFKDSTAYYGETVDTNFDTNNKVSEVWKHNDTLSTSVTILGEKPALDITYTPDSTKLNGTTYGKQDVPVAATVKIGGVDVNEHTTFEHQDCTGKTCALPDGYHFWIHIKTCTLSITKTGGAADESYVFVVKKDGQPYSEVTVWGNGTETIVELPVGTYTITENTGWSWRYAPTYSGGVTLGEGQDSGTITCTNEKTKDYWLNGFSEVVRNIIKK